MTQWNITTLKHTHEHRHANGVIHTHEHIHHRSRVGGGCVKCSAGVAHTHTHKQPAASPSAEGWQGLERKDKMKLYKVTLANGATKLIKALTATEALSKAQRYFDAAGLRNMKVSSVEARPAAK